MVRDQIFLKNSLHKFRYFCVNLFFRRKSVQKTVLRILGMLPSLMIRDQKLLILQLSQNYSTKRRVFKLIFVHSLETNIMNNGESFLYATHVTLNSHVGKLYSTQVKCHADYRKKVQCLAILCHQTSYDRCYSKSD